MPSRRAVHAWPALAARLPLLLSLAGCGSDAQPDVPPDPAPAAVVMRPPSPPDSLCPRDGRWRECLLVDRIQTAGLAVKPSGDTLRQPFLSEPGIDYAVGSRTRLVVFYYDDSAAVERDLAPLDTVRLRPRGDTLSPWPSPPAVIRSANLLAALFTESPRQVERVTLIITAGPPQPVRAAP